MKSIVTRMIFALVALVFITTARASAQDDGPDRRPVKETFNSTLLIDQQTNMGPRKSGLEFIIHHRLGTMEKGFTDLAGIYGASNIRLGFNFGITERLSVGIGTERINKFSDLYAKYLILQQKRTGMPLSLSYLLQVAVDGGSKEDFGQNYQFTNRMTYFNQVIIGRKFSQRLSLQAAPSFSHFNAVDSTHWNDYLGVSVGGRFKFYREMAIIATYDQAWAVMPNLSAASREARKEVLVAPKPSLGLGLEIASPTHCFMVFVSNAYDIVPQLNMGYNRFSVLNEELAKQLHVGFNLTVRF
jgi:hypothetical protein